MKSLSVYIYIYIILYYCFCRVQPITVFCNKGRTYLRPSTVSYHPVDQKALHLKASVTMESTKGAPQSSTRNVKMDQNGRCFRGFPMISMISMISSLYVFFVASCCITILPFHAFPVIWGRLLSRLVSRLVCTAGAFRHKLRFGAILRRRGLLCPEFHHIWVWVKIRYPNNWMVSTNYRLRSVVPRSLILTHIHFTTGSAEANLLTPEWRRFPKMALMAPLKGMPVNPMIESIPFGLGEKTQKKNSDQSLASGLN